MLHYYAPGMVLGILGGLTVALVIAIWPTRSLWLASPQPFEWRSVLRQIIPLTLGFGAYQFLLTADTMLVRGCFSGDDSAFYVSAGTLARASMWLVGPLAAVMFPKIVHAKAKAEKSDLMGVVLLGTLILAAGGATGLWVLGPWVVRFMFGPDLRAARLRAAALVCLGGGAAVAGQRAVEQPAGPLTFQGGSRALCSGRRLRFCAQPFPRHAGNGHPSAGTGSLALFAVRPGHLGRGGRLKRMKVELPVSVT